MTAGTVGVVVIGRNEGERLVRCLESVRGAGLRIVYVDSASSDGSADAARRLGAEVVEVDASRPMGAARSRNEGFVRLLELVPGARYVQFVDGDCELEANWIASALRTFGERADAAVVCGGLRERDARSTIYGRLAASEWSGAPGDVAACGGVSMMRADVFRETGGFRTDSIGGEEPELCLRIRRLGWKIVRVADPMAVHDAAITRFSQWWRRAVRSGYALADGVALHGRAPERYNVRETLSALLWGAAIPTFFVAATVFSIWQAWALVVAAMMSVGCLVFVLRVFGARRRAGDGRSDSWLYAVFCLVGKAPQAAGVARRILECGREKRSAWIEYKDAPRPAC